MGGEDQAVNVYDQFRNALEADQAWAWSWFCNIAVPIMDNLGTTHEASNRAAAALMQHLFKIDVTQWKEYTDLEKAWKEQNQPKAVAAPITPPDVDESSIYINITGFKANSGAEATARALAGLLDLNGYRTNLNIADTALAESERSKVEPPKNTLFMITGVESRYDTDRLGAVEVDEQAEAIVDDYIAQRQEREEIVAVPEEDEYPVDYGDDDFDADCDSPDCGECDGFGDDDDGYRKGHTTLELVLSNTDTNPVATLKFFEQQFPAATINTRIEVDPFVTDSIHRQMDPKRTIVLTLDPADPDPEATIAAVTDLLKGQSLKTQEAVDHLNKTVEGMSWKTQVTITKDGVTITPVEKPESKEEHIRELVSKYISPEFLTELMPEGFDPVTLVTRIRDQIADNLLGKAEQAFPLASEVPEETGLTLISAQRSLANPEDLNGAHLIEHRDGTHSIQFIDTEVCPVKYAASNWRVVDPGYYFIHSLESVLPDVTDEQANAIASNNARFLEKYPAKSFEQEPVLEELDFLALDQSQVPNDLWDILEKAWTTFNSIEQCSLLQTRGVLGDDLGIFAIPYEEYEQITGVGNIVYRRHPQHKKLFVRLVRWLATSDPAVHKWARRQNLLK